MEWLTNLIDILKIPVKIILPTAWMFSGALSFVQDSFLQKLGLLEWRNEHKMVLGLVFLIASCLIVVYIFWFLAEKFKTVVFERIKGFILDKTLYPRTAHAMQELSDVEIAILIALYSTPDYTKTLDCSHPVVQQLMAKQYVHMGASQLVSANRITGAISGKVTLQSRVYKTLNHYKPKLEKQIATLEKRVSKAQNESKRQAMQDKLADLKEKYYCVYEGGIND